MYHHKTLSSVTLSHCKLYVGSWDKRGWIVESNFQLFYVVMEHTQDRLSPLPKVSQLLPTAIPLSIANRKCRYLPGF